jgi:hypothetical protein
MSDEHKDPSHKTEGPGHEVDAPPTKELFNIVWGFGGLTLLSIVTCAQLFYQQERDIAEERSKETSYQLAAYRKEMTEKLAGTGTSEFKDQSGIVHKHKLRPLAEAREEVLRKPEALRASRPPPGWVHPDDIAAGGQGGTAGAPAPADQAIGAPGVPNPAGIQPGVGAPSGGLVHPLGEPAALPSGTGPVDPTSAEPIRQPPVQPPPPTPSVPAVNPAPAPAPPVAPAPSPAAHPDPHAPAK